MKKIWLYIKAHKKTTIVVILIIIAAVWYYQSTHTTTATSYTVKPATIGTVRTTVSGTGQVSSSQELAIYPQVSGKVLSVKVHNGDTVTKGQVLATLDSTNAYFSLENARISLAKLQTSNPISNVSDENTVVTNQNSLTQNYQSAFNTIATSYNNLGSITTGLNDIFYGKNSSPYFTDVNVGATTGVTGQQYRLTAGVLLDKATSEYAAFRDAYINIDQNSTTSITKSLDAELAMVKDLNDAVKASSVAVNYVIGQTALSSRTNAMTSDQNNITSWLTTVGTDNVNLSNAKATITNSQQSYTQALANLSANQTTNSPLDLRAAELSLEQAQTTFDEYTIRAPFDGVIGNVTLHTGDNAGASTIIGTVVTKDYVSTIVLNEVDVAKVSVGQPVVVTFNALPNVTATGTVIDVDSVGSVSQGVVSYNVKISINSDNPNIKAGMSINASIVTAQESNVIVVPNSAIKTVNGRSFVQIPTTPVVNPYQANASSTGSTKRRYNGTANVGISVASVVTKPVTVGLSDNTNTEIMSGLNAGDYVVTQTLTGTAAKAASTNILSSLTGGARTGGGTGGGFTGGTRTAAPAAAASAGR